MLILVVNQGREHLFSGLYGLRKPTTGALCVGSLDLVSQAHIIFVCLSARKPQLANHN